MSCRIEQELTAYVDGELDEVTRQKVTAHLPTCASCRQTEMLLRNAVMELRGMPAFEASAQLRRDVMNRLDAEDARRSRRRASWLLRPWLLVPAGAIAAGLVAFVSLHSTVTSTTPTEQLDVQDPGQLEIAQNMDELENFDLVGLEDPDDLEVIAHLDELEAMP